MCEKLIILDIFQVDIVLTTLPETIAMPIEGLVQYHTYEKFESIVRNGSQARVRNFPTFLKFQVIGILPN